MVALGHAYGSRRRWDGTGSTSMAVPNRQQDPSGGPGDINADIPENSPESSSDDSAGDGGAAGDGSSGGGPGKPPEDGYPGGYRDAVRDAGQNGRGKHMTLLARTIEAEIVPRLILTGRAAPDCLAIPTLSGAVPGLHDAIAFAESLLADTDADAACFIERMQARGVALESIYLDLMAPAARHLGFLWEDDQCDFATVTVALCRLERLVRELSPSFQNEAEHRGQGRRVLLVPVPGEQHTFGLSIVAEFFRREGWTVWSGPLAGSAELAKMVRNEWFAVIGFSLSCESRLPVLAKSIRTVRRTSRNPAIGVMVGGPAFRGRPDLVALAGADATAVDGRQAALQAQSLLALLASRN